MAVADLAGKVEHNVSASNHPPQPGYSGNAGVDNPYVPLDRSEVMRIATAPGYKGIHHRCIGSELHQPDNEVAAKESQTTRYDDFAPTISVPIIGIWIHHGVNVP
jgi:hypothetical protein